MPTSHPQQSFDEYVAQNTISPNTMAILQRVEEIHNKAKRDDANMQRIKREQRMVEDATNLMKTPSLFGNPHAARLDITGTEGNILQGPNLFKEQPQLNVLRKRPFSIMQTREAGNNLKF